MMVISFCSYLKFLEAQNFDALSHKMRATGKRILRNWIFVPLAVNSSRKYAKEKAHAKEYKVEIKNLFEEGKFITEIAKMLNL